MSGGARETWSSVTSRFQSDSPLSLRAELLERTSEIHSSGARERENYPLRLLRRRSSGEIFQISPPPSSSSRNNDAISKQISLSSELAIPRRRGKAELFFPGVTLQKRPPKLVSANALPVFWCRRRRRRGWRTTGGANERRAGEGVDDQKREEKGATMSGRSVGRAGGSFFIKRR